MSRSLVCLVLSLLLALPLQAGQGSPPPRDEEEEIDFITAEEAFAAGQVRGYEDGLAAGREVRRTAGSKSLDLMEVAQVAPRGYSGNHSLEYSRGYKDGYEMAFQNGYAEGKRHYQGGGCGFALGFFLSLLGVLIAVAMP